MALCVQVCGSVQPGHLAVRGTRPRHQAPADQRRPQRRLCHSEGPSWLRPAAAKHSHRSHSGWRMRGGVGVRGGGREKRSRVVCPLDAADVFHPRSDSVPAVPWLLAASLSAVQRDCERRISPSQPANWMPVQLICTILVVMRAFAFFLPPCSGSALIVPVVAQQDKIQISIKCDK